MPESTGGGTKWFSSQFDRRRTKASSIPIEDSSDEGTPVLPEADGYESLDEAKTIDLSLEYATRSAARPEPTGMYTLPGGPLGARAVATQNSLARSISMLLKKNGQPLQEWQSQMLDFFIDGQAHWDGTKPSAVLRLNPDGSTTRLVEISDDFETERERHYQEHLEDKRILEEREIWPPVYRGGTYSGPMGPIDLTGFPVAATGSVTISSDGNGEVHIESVSTQPTYEEQMQDVQSREEDEDTTPPTAPYEPGVAYQMGDQHITLSAEQAETWGASSDGVQVSHVADKRIYHPAGVPLDALLTPEGLADLMSLMDARGLPEAYVGVDRQQHDAADEKTPAPPTAQEIVEACHGGQRDLLLDVADRSFTYDPMHPRSWCALPVWQTEVAFSVAAMGAIEVALVGDQEPFAIASLNPVGVEAVELLRRPAATEQEAAVEQIVLTALTAPYAEDGAQMRWFPSGTPTPYARSTAKRIVRDLHAYLYVPLNKH